MSRLMIVAGASGAGKSFLLEQLSSRDTDVEAVKKLSSRTAREYEKQGKQVVDLVFGVAPETVRQCEYNYSYGQHWYGIQKADIDSVLSRSRTPIVIVRSSRIVRQLKRDYPSALAIFVQGVLSGDDLTRRLTELGRSDIRIGERRVRDESDFADYCNNVDAYDYVILNRFESDTFMAQYESVVSRELKKVGAANSVCLVSGNQSAERITKIETLLKHNGHDQYGLTRLGELQGGVVIAKSVEERLEHSDLVVVDVDSADGKHEYYIGYLRANRKDFVTLIKDGIHFGNSGALDVSHYDTEEEFLDILGRKFHEYLRISPARKVQPVVLHFMEEAIRLAARSTFEDSTPRPFVGAVLVDENFQEVAAECRGGNDSTGEHAEFRLFRALAQKNISKAALKNYTLFVTLEPCTSRSHPKTPCADHVISSGVGNVYIGMLDPDTRIRGFGLQRLKKAGLVVDTFPDEYERRIRQLNEAWIEFVLKRDYQQ